MTAHEHIDDTKDATKVFIFMKDANIEPMRYFIEPK